jgi:hypothetical protein
MDWLVATGLFLLGWFGKKLKRFAESVLDITWFLVRHADLAILLLHEALYGLSGGSYRSAEGGALERGFLKGRAAVH